MTLDPGPLYNAHMQRSGFVAIAGQPNVGKSTLLNGLLNKKLAIVSRKPETTRDNIRGILTQEDCQIVLTDTPGIHRVHNLLGKIMLTRAQSALLEADIILMVTEKRLALNTEDMNIISRFPEPGKNTATILIINKVDRIKQKGLLLPLIKKAEKIYPFDEIIPMSALNDGHIKKLLSIIKSYLPEKKFEYPIDQLTDKSDEFMISELIREKILERTHEEIPHSSAVIINEISENKKTGLLSIKAAVVVERTSQKAIIIGKNGTVIKTIGKMARSDIENTLSRKVQLELWVTVQEKWKKDPEAMREMGYTD